MRVCDTILKYIMFVAIAVSSIFMQSCAKRSEVQKIVLNTNWKIQSSNKVKVVGSAVSTKVFDDKLWYNATVPGTVLANLVRCGVYKDVYVGKNLAKIPTKQFENAWWYRTQFKVIKNKITNTQLVFEGINYKATIWLNGKLIASTDSIEGPFRIFKFDISNYIVSGVNTLAVQVYPPQKMDLTIGFVDWNPNAPDNNMGLWRGVYIKQSGIVELADVAVRTKVNTKTLKSADITVIADLINHTQKKQIVVVDGSIGEILFSNKYILLPNQKKQVKISPKTNSVLHVDNPKLWWSNNMGAPNLHNLNLTLRIQDKISDKSHVRFGIREVGQFINSEGHKGFTVNGKKVLIRGGGWVDDVMLADDSAKVAAQVKYAKDMNLNAIRLEGFWGNSQTLYDKCDENGILLMLGWSCHWEWEDYCGRPEDLYMSITSRKDIDLQAKSYANQVWWLRNHPSIFVWVYGSDKLPTPSLELLLNHDVFSLDSTRPILASCKYKDFAFKEAHGVVSSGYINNSTVSGPTGVKMLGPYAYVTPNYWYVDKQLGGAYGFNTETGPGPQVPPLSSIKKMIPADHLWPIDSVWDYHCGRHEFKSLDYFLNAFNARYGKARSVEDFAYRTQISNYEAIRAMYEAFAVNKFNATGVIQWMLNSAWPEMYWQLYDWYLMPTGAYFGTKTACNPLHLIYNYGDKNIYISNETLNEYKHLKAHIQLFNSKSELVYSKDIPLDVRDNSAKKIMEMPSITNISDVYFLNLNLFDAHKRILSNNFYWLSKKEDIHDFKKSEWFKTPYSSFADFKSLNTLAKAKIEVSFEKHLSKNNIVVKIHNKSKVIAFFTEFQLIDENSGDNILPVFWSDNYISLLPNQHRTISVRYNKVDSNVKPKVIYQGLNIQ